MDWTALAMGAVGGLVLFLYGVHELSHALKAVAGERMKNLIGMRRATAFAASVPGRPRPSLSTPPR